MDDRQLTELHTGVLACWQKYCFHQPGNGVPEMLRTRLEVKALQGATHAS
jgi:hypothetical protein